MDPKNKYYRPSRRAGPVPGSVPGHSRTGTIALSWVFTTALAGRHSVITSALRQRRGDTTPTANGRASLEPSSLTPEP